MRNASNSFDRFKRPRLLATDNHLVNALSPQRCRARATECTDLALKAVHIEARELLLQVAASWHWLADELGV